MLIKGMVLQIKEWMLLKNSTQNGLALERRKGRYTLSRLKLQTFAFQSYLSHLKRRASGYTFIVVEAFSRLSQDDFAFAVLSLVDSHREEGTNNSFIVIIIIIIGIPIMT